MYNVQNDVFCRQVSKTSTFTKKQSFTGQWTTYSQECWTDELPGDPPVESRSVTQHGEDVITEVVETIHPGHRHCLEEDRGQQ